MDAEVQERLTQIEIHLSRLFDSRQEVLRYYGAAFRYFLGSCAISTKPRS